MNSFKGNAMVVLFLVSFLFPTIAGGKNRVEPEKALYSRKVSLSPVQGESSVTLSWLQRPGEFALTIEYWGPLTQEGPVNLWLSCNGFQRDFITLREMPDRKQRLTILSFHPTETAPDGTTRLRALKADEVVDRDLFQNAAYYAPFGRNHLEFKFFANGRWEGDPQAGNGNWICEFEPPVG